MQYVPVPTLLAIFTVTTALAVLRSLTARRRDSGEFVAKAYLRVVGEKHVCIPCSGYDC